MDFNFEDTSDTAGKYTIDLKHVMESNQLLGTTRLLAMDIQNKGYVNVGEFFKNLNESDLQKYLDLADSPDDDIFSEILLVSELLAMGEGLDNGLDENNLQISQNRMSQMIMYLACESLARKGMVKLYHENISFGEDMNNKVVVEKI